MQFEKIWYNYQGIGEGTFIDPCPLDRFELPNIHRRLLKRFYLSTYYNSAQFSLAEIKSLFTY